MSNILPYHIQKSQKRHLENNSDNPQAKKKNNNDNPRAKQTAYYGTNLLDEYKMWRGQRQINPIIKNSAKQDAFEIFMREKTGNTDDSIDKIMFKIGGKYLWKNPILITESNFQLFFPGMNHKLEKNFEAYKKFKKAFISCKDSSFYFNYFNVSFCVRMSFDENICEFTLSLKDMIETDGENIKLIELEYQKMDHQLYLHSFFDVDLNEYSVIFKYKDKLVGYEKRKGALQKRGFLYIRLITNLIRSTSATLDNVSLIDAWSPMKGQMPEDEDDWQQYIKDKNWQGDFMGNGKQGSAKDMENYGFYANFMKGKEQTRGDVTKYFEPWISGTATQF